MLRLLDGRYPTGADEVALTDRAASLFGAGIGDTIDIRSTPHTVVGLVENPGALDDEFVLAAPDPTAPADFVNVLTTWTDDGPDVARGDRSRPARHQPATASGPTPTWPCSSCSPSRSCWPSSGSSPRRRSSSSPNVANASSACSPPSADHRVTCAR